MKKPQGRWVGISSNFAENINILEQKESIFLEDWLLGGNNNKFFVIVVVFFIAVKQQNNTIKHNKLIYEENQLHS